MEKIKIHFLGTGNAIPTKKRNHSAILLIYKHENVLIDCGEGTQRQFKMADLSPSKLTKLLITHWHGDHILGLPGLFQTLRMSEYSRALEVYGPKKTKEYLNSLEKLFNIKINLDVKEVNNKFFETKEFYLESAEMSHGTPCLAYSFVIKDRLRLDKKKLAKYKLPNSPLISKLQNGENVKFNNKTIKAKDVTYLEKGRKITIILDTLPNNNAVKLATNSHNIICESTFSKEEEKTAKEYLHLTSEQAAHIAKKSNSKKLILTHISQRYEHNPNKILSEAKKVFRNTFLVNDFDVIEI